MMRNVNEMHFNLNEVSLFIVSWYEVDMIYSSGIHYPAVNSIQNYEVQITMLYFHVV